MEGALDDLTVLDLGQVIATPMCTMLLADMGARIVKVESREGIVSPPSFRDGAARVRSLRS